MSSVGFHGLESATGGNGLRRPRTPPVRGPAARGCCAMLVAALAGCDVSPGEATLAGRWQLVEKQLATDGCRLVEPGQEGHPCQLSCEPVSVRATGASTWEMRFIERGGTADCESLPDGWFRCVTEDTRGPPGAQVHRIDTMEGRPQTDGSIRGVFALEMVCTGPGCGLQPAFAKVDRCETRGTFRGERLP